MQEPVGYELDAREALSRLAFLLVSHCPPERTEYSERILRTGVRMRTMLTYIQENVQAELTVADIAGSAAVGESECLRCFRALLGTTPIRYVRQLRLQRAAELLETTELPISEIAARCGFQDLSYFSKCFREAMGCAPRRYRGARLSG